MSSNVLPPEFDSIRSELLQAGKDNVSTRGIVEKYKPNIIPHDMVLDPDLQLKLLHIAAWTGDVETIRELQNRANPAAKTEGGLTALHLAASRGHSNALRELLGWNGVDAHSASSVEGFTALHLAAYCGYDESVGVLLGVCDVNSKDEMFGRTALHFAAQRGHEKVVDLLTSFSGVDVRSNDKVRDLTPFLLAAMQPKGRCSLRLVERLLDADAGQINDNVGFLTDRTIDEAVGIFFNQVWRELTTIEIDNSMKRIPEVDDEVDEEEVDLYRRFAVPLEGHTALHLAATQNNAELVSHLANCTGVRLNKGDTEFGMTPLHCAVRMGAMEAFSALMAVDEVNINAKLVKAGWLQRPLWLPPDTAFTFNFTGKNDFSIFRYVVPYDTPLHLAVRVCQAEDLSEMITEFCNHPRFDSAIYNKSKLSSLQLAWARLSYCARTPSILEIRKKVSTDPQLVRVEKYQYEDKIHLKMAIDLMEGHPSNASVMNTVAETMKSAQDSANAFLVTATLLAGLTFSAYLQPPFGTNVGDYRSKPARFFWAFNSLSFYFAVYTILRSLLCIMRSDERLENMYRRLEYAALIRIEITLPLTLSAGFGVGAFVAAGYANLPPESKSLMLACTISGLLLVLFQLFRNLYNGFGLIVTHWLLFEEALKLSDYILFSSLILGGPLFCPLFLVLQYHGSGQGKIVSLHESESLADFLHLGFLGVQLWLVIAVIIYTLIEA